MASLTGKWQMTSVENLEAYLTATHSPEEFKKKMLALPTELPTNPNTWIQEINVNTTNNTVQLIVFIKGEQKYDSGVVTVGTEIEKTGVDGRPATIKINIESDTKITLKKKVADIESLATFTLTTTNDLTSTLTSGGVTSTEKYKRV
jgi:hypothetical protein